MNSRKNFINKKQVFPTDAIAKASSKPVFKFHSFIVIGTIMSIAFSFSSCKKDKVYQDIPNVSVNLALQLSLPEFASLNSVGNSVEIAGGYKGILVYHRFQNDFVAFEQACPYDPVEPNSFVEKDASGVIGEDKNCGSKFGLTDGHVINGPATKPLKQYTTDYDAGSRTLYIFN
ncbi:MAG: hypothetical protein DWQ44_04150 [Bacteroidetes bacterium]|nr:MAG: hypothetical protein DWQ33_13835 [Bacteroidota bacterium]REK00379.1 MAG: hypothetical protein DWQ39_12045 [Bacteroidota bacterium]REK35498.1 MAG: hypothetical protein DWQ44_04150 [Bacteroidota bacterium]REK50169.1 MAG: hypothetical protein DWQ48_05115 [Bacteroidota bacterium]